LAVPTLVLVIGAVNLYWYFGLEARNNAALRVMAYAPRLLGLEAARDDSPVYFIGNELFAIPAHPTIEEKIARANSPVILPVELQKLAVIIFSGRYDRRRTLTGNFENPKDLRFGSAEDLSAFRSAPRVAKFIFPSENRNVREILSGSNAAFRDIADMQGKPMFTVAVVSSSLR
jgi:hypothetical protein